MRVPAVVLVVSGIVIAAAVPAAFGAPAPSPRPTWGPFDFWGSITPTAGWGWGPANVTHPGPPITVTQGETVTFRLYSADGFKHRWVLDLNRNQIPDAGDVQSANFTSGTTPTPFSFVASAAPGTYEYFCGIHGTAQNGTFVILAGNAPTISLTNPDGTTVNRWTGGSQQTLTWTMTNPSGRPLAVWLNYSFNAGANLGTIVGPPTLPFGAMNYLWTIPFIDASDYQIIATAADPGGAHGTDTKPVPVLDSTPPRVTATVPAWGNLTADPGTPINVTFSEAMDRTSAQNALTLCRMPGCAPVVLLSAAWNGNTLTMQPSVRLLVNADYQGTVAATARDASTPGNPMAGDYVWTFRTTNPPPTVSVVQPAAGMRWTGGVDHTIIWTASDLDDPVSALAVWVNYSANGVTWTSVVGPVRGLASWTWTFPTDDTSTARVRVDVQDTGGATGSALSAPFVVDSTPPTVAATSPAQGASNVPVGANIVVTFSEAMGRSATASPAVVSLFDVSSGAWLPQLSYSWGSGDTVLTATPLGPLVTAAHYRLYVNGTARDAADPGLTMGAARTADFNTTAVADTTSPTIAFVTIDPPIAAQGGTVAITAAVTDNVGVASVAVNVTQPDGVALNLTMAHGTGDTWTAARVWTQVGVHAFVVWALDTSGNVARANATFEIVAADTTPPEIVPTYASAVQSGAAFAIGATITDASPLRWIYLNYTDVDGQAHSVQMTVSAGTYEATIPAQAHAGTVRFRIYAADVAGNGNTTREYSVAVTGATSSDVLPLVLALVLVVAAVLLVLTVLWRRRRKSPEPPPPPSP